MKLHKGFACRDCKKDTWNEYFMLYNKVWKKANPELKGKLCIGCVENRLGRKLSKKDFTKRLVNSIKDVRSSRLKNRLSN